MLTEVISDKAMSQPCHSHLPDGCSSPIKVFRHDAFRHSPVSVYRCPGMTLHGHSEIQLVSPHVTWVPVHHHRQSAGVMPYMAKAKFHPCGDLPRTPTWRSACSGTAINSVSQYEACCLSDWCPVDPCSIGLCIPNWEAVFAPQLEFVSSSHLTGRTDHEG